MAALRSLEPELEVEVAAWRREFERRIKNPHVCVICGYSHEFCACPSDREDYSNDSGIDVGVE